MKNVCLAVLGVSILAGLLLIKRPHTPAVSQNEPGSAAASIESAEAVPGEGLVPVAPEPVKAATPVRSQTEQVRPPEAVPARPYLDAAILGQAIDVLVSPQATYAQKQVAWKQLCDAGKLDQAINELEHRMASDPRSAEYPAALGQAYLKKCATLQDVREQGILGMQADKVFDTALNLDPSNWEARFTKALALSFWPATLNKGNEVIQHFQTLIQQQETQPPQPQFAESYLWLGDQYLKSGQADSARSVWERGSALYPSHDALRNRLATASGSQAAIAAPGQ